LATEVVTLEPVPAALVKPIFVTSVPNCVSVAVAAVVPVPTAI